jgi:hypothetical protein
MRKRRLGGFTVGRVDGGRDLFHHLDDDVDVPPRDPAFGNAFGGLRESRLEYLALHVGELPDCPHAIQEPVGLSAAVEHARDEVGDGLAAGFPVRGAFVDVDDVVGERGEHATLGALVLDRDLEQVGVGTVRGHRLADLVQQCVQTLVLVEKKWL